MAFVAFRRSRITSATLALLLHLGFLALLIQSLTIRPSMLPMRVRQELIFQLPRLPADAPSAGNETVLPRAPAVVVPSLPVSPASPETSTPAASSGLSQMGQALFGCAPEIILA